MVVAHLAADALQILLLDASLAQVLALRNMCQRGRLVATHMVHDALFLVVVALNDVKLATVQRRHLFFERQRIRPLLNFADLVR